MFCIRKACFVVLSLLLTLVLSGRVIYTRFVCPVEEFSNFELPERKKKETKMGRRMIVISLLVFLTSEARSLPSTRVQSAQNLKFNADGSYSFGYELSDGSYRYVNADASGAVFGGYGYRSADGEDIDIHYTAGREGFRPMGTNLKNIPDVPTGEGVEYDEYGNPLNPQTRTDEDYYDENADKSYNFGFQSDAYSRQETADSSGYVIGSYQYIDADGVQRSLSYRAGAGTGFVPVANYLPVNNAQVKSVTPAHTQSLNFAKSTQQQLLQQQQYNKPLPLPSQQNLVPQVPSQLYSIPGVSDTAAASVPIPIVPQQPALPVAPELPPKQVATSPQGMVMDASYQFGYSGEGSSRQEEADQSGNVKGQYAYTNAEGNVINVRYSAGAGTGFVVENADQLSQSVRQATLNPKASIAYKAPPQPGVPIAYSQPQVLPSMILSNRYSFGYSGLDASHEQESDEDGNVRGSYTTLDANGQPMVVRYIAGKNIGFVIENMEELLQRSRPATTEASGEAINVTPVKASVSPISVAQPVQAATVGYVAPVSQTSVQSKPSQLFSYQVSVTEPRPSVPKTITRPKLRVVKRPRPSLQRDSSYSANKLSGETKDRSYSFSYNEHGNTRQEQADKSGNIRGQYSYVNAEGNKIAVKYNASPNGGFVIENKDELEQSVQKATLDGARVAASFKTAEHRQKGVQRVRQTIKRVQKPSGIRFPSFRRRQQQKNTVSSGYKVTTETRSQQNVRKLPVPGIQAPNFRRRQYSSTSSAGASSSQKRKMVVVRKRKPVTAKKQSGYNYSPPEVPANLYTLPEEDTGDDEQLSPMPMDASFDFTYQASGHHREEVADVNGERLGSYSYVTPEGEKVNVRYRAGRNGFEILNPEDILPKPAQN